MSDGHEPADPQWEAIGAVFAGLGEHQARALAERLAHVREAVTGYACGFAQLAGPGEPRPQYDPGLPVMQRFAAKAAELGVSVRTMQRWAARLAAHGAVGLVDGRERERAADVLAGVDARWIEVCVRVLAEHTDASRPTAKLVLERVAARCTAEFGAGVVALPGSGRARRVLAELSRGSNALRGSTRGKRTAAQRPNGPYGRLRATRPGEYLLLDTTALDVFAMEPVTLRWVRAELTVAIDLFSRCVTGLRLSPVSTKSVDAAVVVCEALREDSRSHTSRGLLPYAGLPDALVLDAERAETWGGLPATAVECAVVDHGKIFLSEHLRAVCQRLGISIQPARPYMPTDKAVVERFFKSLSEGLLVALPGYKGPDVYGRGRDPQECAYYFLDELESIIREWISGVYHRRAHEGLVEPGAPGVALCPLEMLDAGLRRAGRPRVPADPGMVYDLLAVAWRTIQHYGVEVGGMRYNGAALAGYRNRSSGMGGRFPGKWPIRYDADDMSRVYFRDPADGCWHVLEWEHAAALGAPFSKDTMDFARRLALAEGRHVAEHVALAELLERWDAGLARHPVERRLAVRAGEQRRARLAAWQPVPESAEALPQAAVSGDDDLTEETQAPGPGDEAYYAEALEVLR